MLTSELFSIVDQYLDRDIGLEQLEDWLVPRLPFYFKLPYSIDSEFVADIEVGLAEMSDQSRTEDEFRSLLRDLRRQATTISMTYPAEGQFTYAESSNQVSPDYRYPIPDVVAIGQYLDIFTFRQLQYADTVR